MRQGEVTKGKWIGDPLGGVKAPRALILPDPATRFANTAVRLEALSAGHPMENWLRFMAHLHGRSMPLPSSRNPATSLRRSRWSRRCAHACRLFLRMGIVATRLGATSARRRPMASTTNTYQRRRVRSWRACAIARPMMSRSWPTIFSSEASPRQMRAQHSTWRRRCKSISPKWLRLCPRLPCGSCHSADCALAAARHPSLAW